MTSSRMRSGRHRGYILLMTVIALASAYVEQVVSLPADIARWPTFPRRNIAALARSGYIKGSKDGFKRSISVLAKNGQLPTYKSPYDENDKREQYDDESHEKRNIASIARMRSYASTKRNIQALARDGARFGRDDSSNKRNIASLARNGMLIHKREDGNEDEYYFPFYQNSIPPLSEVDGPLDYSELYDLQQSINPDMFPPLSQVYRRSVFGAYPYIEQQYSSQDDPWHFKRDEVGSPVHGLYRPTYTEANGRTKRYILSLPDFIDTNEHNEDENQNGDKRSVDTDDNTETRDMFEKRHIGSLARLGLLPSFRFTGGRYSRSGRARLLLPSQELYRKHSSDENFGIRKYITSAETEPAADTDDTILSPPPVPAHSHPTGRILHRPLKNDHDIIKPYTPKISYSYINAINDNIWQPSDELPRTYFKPHKDFRYSNKRYLLMPAIDNILIRKNYPNSSLPSRWKNQ